MNFPRLSVSLYIILCGFQNLIQLPIVNEKIQLADFWFLLMLAYCCFHLREFRATFLSINNCKALQHYFLAWSALLILILVSLILNWNLSAALECIGLCYLFLLQIVFIVFIMKYNVSIVKLIHAFIYMGLLLSLIGIIGWSISYLGIPNQTAELYTNYPYFGNCLRLKAFTTTPSMYISLVTLSIIFSLYVYEYENRDWKFLWIGIFCSVVGVLSFAKSYLFIGLIWIIVLINRSRHQSKLQLIFISFMGIGFIHILATHFMVLPSSLGQNQIVMESPYSSAETLFKTDSKIIVGTSYYALKKASCIIFKEHPFFGVGLTNYNKELCQLKYKGKYPNHLPEYDPHSSYFGLLAELGIVGFLAWMLIGLSLFKIAFKLKPFTDPFAFWFLILLGIFSIEAFSMDVLNFRHYWILIALMLTVAFKTVHSK